MNDRIEAEIKLSMERIRAAREQRDRVNENRARVQCDNRRIRVAIGGLILIWIVLILLFWRFG
jgi:hypothetical protein